MLTLIKSPIMKKVVMCLVTIALVMGMLALSTGSASAATKGSVITKTESSSYCKVTLQNSNQPGSVKFNCKSSGPIKYSGQAKIVLRDKNNKWLCEWVANDGDVFNLGKDHKEYRIYIKTTGAAIQYFDYSFTNPKNVTIS